ncbi:APC family permease [Nonomuraea sp. NEAU-A123]|uniref:APC family permease n=1 Tax=Nonomuraea sp. NEAU-A123 TaxID=2839649 RepID=UPI001BE3D8F1|nr:APC family permease [Nonomuraea sp. NEAU-A123]MBT2228325.1 APC family permease [Nonomuraea sp. NEAU-A123]
MELSRRLGTADAVVVGLSAMIGAGVFAAFAPAAAAAGSWLLAALALAAVVAYCNATSSARLAALYPESGGTYVYGRRRLGPVWGYLAGWGFTVGKTASCAAMALTFGSYVAPGLARPLAIAAVVALTALNLFGVQRSAMAARVMVAFVLAVLVAVVAIGLLSGPDASSATGSEDGARSADGLPSNARIVDKDQRIDLSSEEVAALIPKNDVVARFYAIAEQVAEAYHPTPWDVLQGAGLLFFAFAGYARIATLGEEVRDPARTIPRAITAALAVTLVVYALVAVTALSVLGPMWLGASGAPLADVATASGAAWLRPVVSAGAAVAALGALLALLLGVSRTVLAMARRRDLPELLAEVHSTTEVPRRAELAVGVVVVGLLLVADLRGAIGFSSFGVLVYYAIANACALTLGPDEGAPPKAVPVLGLALCLLLAATLPLTSVLAGLAVFAVGLIIWKIRHRGPP